MKRTTLAATLLAALASTPVLAQSPWYVGIGGGLSKTSSDLVENRESTVVNAVVTGSEFDGEDGAFKAFVGYRHSEHLAFEFGYAHLGESRLFTGILAGNPGIPGSVTMDREISGLGIDAVLRYPLGQRFAVFGRVGAVVARVKAHAVLDGNIVFTNPPGNTDRERTTTFEEMTGRYGLGAEWSLSERAALRLEWERWGSVGKAFRVGGTGTTGESDIDVYAVSAVFRF